MLNILHIIPSLSKGGAERLVLDICNELSKKEGIKVKLVTFSNKNDYEFLTTNIDWQVVEVNLNLSILKKNKINIEHLQNVINEFNPDIIHSHLFKAEIVSRSCYYPNAKWFSHCHDNMIQFENFSLKTLFYKYKLTNFFEKLYLIKQYKKNGGNNFIAISKDTQNYFQTSIKNFTITHLANAINYNLFYKQLEEINNVNILKLINVGSLVNKKNQTFLIDIANELRIKEIEFELLILGDGKNRPYLENKIKKNKLEKQIKITGHVNNVEQYLWKSNLYIHTATYEPFGLVLLEAMAAGLPVISLDGKGNRDIIEQDKNGYMIFEQNAELFANKIIELRSNTNKYIQISKYAQEYAKKFDIKNYVNNLIGLYNKALDE